MAKTKTTTKTARPTKAAASKKATTRKTTTKNGKEKAKKFSAIDAAAQILGGAKQPLTTSEMIDAIAEKGLWKSPGGKTPDRTLYSAILREIATKGKEARFKKTERGKFAANG